jgi:Asp-tRNA(Asn)/Glu-tRNA(Gln) amidotransferase B subunit
MKIVQKKPPVKTSKIVREDSKFEYGQDYEDDVLVSDWMRVKTDHWSSLNSYDLVRHCGFEIGYQKSHDLINFADGNYETIYYIASLSHEEAIKWLMGPIAVELKASKRNLKDLMPVSYLNLFVDYLLSGKFDKSFAKDIFDVYATAVKFRTVPIVAGEIMLDIIISDPKYRVAGTSEVDTVIDKVISNNPVQVEKAKADHRIMHWLVGQCMKELKGKASAPVLLEKITKLLTA